jgi:hypothetical protein
MARVHRIGQTKVRLLSSPQPRAAVRKECRYRNGRLTVAPDCLGQVVHVYRLVVEGTIEERVVQHSEKKLYLDQMVRRNLAPSSLTTPTYSLPHMQPLLPIR